MKLEPNYYKDFQLTKETNFYLGKSKTLNPNIIFSLK